MLGGMTRTMWLFAITAALVGCNKKSETGKAPDKASAGTDDRAKPAAPPAAAVGFKRLGSLPLEAEVPNDANIDDNTKGAGFPSVTIYASPTTFVSGGGDMSDLKPSIEDTKTQLGKDPNKLKAITKEEKTADGWVIELTRDSMVEPGKELFGVSVRRNINGTPWDCGTNAMSADERTKAEKICTSLRAAK